MVLRQVGFAIIMETMEVTAVPQDLLCAMMTSPLVIHAPVELARDSGSMTSGTLLLQGSHHGRNHSGGNGGGATRFALGNDDDVATGW
jgi:hypothetical protein